MEKVMHFVKEWYGGLLFWLYAGCHIYVASISNAEQYRGNSLILINPVMIFLVVSVVGLMIYGLFKCSKALAEELPKEMRRISKELHRPKK